jgi:hypothetical protein
LDALDRATELLLLFEPEAILKVDPEAIKSGETVFMVFAKKQGFFFNLF